MNEKENDLEDVADYTPRLSPTPTPRADANDIIKQLTLARKQAKKHGQPNTIIVDPKHLTGGRRDPFLRECDRLGIKLTFHPAGYFTQ